MKVFSTYFKIQKYYSVMLSIYIVIFIIITIVFTNIGITQGTTEFTAEKSDIAIIDNDSSNLSKSIVSLLSEKHNVKDIENDQQALTDALYNRKVVFILTIPKNFEADFSAKPEIPKIQTQSVPNTFDSMYISKMLDSYLNTIKAYSETGFDIEKSINNATEDMNVSAEVLFKNKHEEGQASIFFFFSFLPYPILMSTIFGIGIALLAFTKREVEMRTNASAISLTRKNMELGLGMTVMAISLLIILIIFGTILNGSQMLTSGAMICLLNMLCFSFFAVALAFLIGVLAKSINVINGAANAIGLAMCFIGGVFVPRDVMNEGVLNIAKLVPTYWYTNALEKVIYGDGLNAKLSGSIAIDMLIQLLFAVALIAIAMVVSKQKRRIN